MNHGVKYVLDCLRRSADNSACWPVYPAEAGALLSEFERLRKENEELRGERGDAVAFVRGARLDDLADAMERGEHRKEKP